MSHPDEKGTNVTPTKRSSKTPSAATGLFARLRAFRRGGGSGAPSSSRGFPLAAASRRIALATGMFLSVGAFFLAVAPAPADNPIFQQFEIWKVNSTRVGFALRASNFFTLEKLEYATSSGGPWTVGAAELDSGGAGWLYVEVGHLAPQTHYYARAVIGRHGGVSETAEKTVEFTTTAIAPPIFLGGLSEGVPSEGWWSSISGPTRTSEDLAAEVYANGAETSYHFEYSTSKSAVESGSGILIAGASGSLSAGEDVKGVPVDLAGLSPETTYYVRGAAENEKGATSTAPVFGFTTKDVRPQVGNFVAVDPTASSAHLRARVNPNGFETHWRFEYATSQGGPWSDGPEGVIPQAQAAASEEVYVEAELTGLSSATSYYVRLHAENEPEPGHPLASTSEKASAFHTSGPPAPDTFAVHALHGEALRLLGYVEPNNSGLNELQTVTIGGAPTGGTFTLTTAGRSVIATGAGNLTAGSKVVEEVQTASGYFHQGEPISGAGIPVGTTVTEAYYTTFKPGSNDEYDPQLVVELSQSATATVKAVALTAGLPKIPFDASYQEVQNALQALLGAEGIEVLPGPTGGPYTVEFLGALGSTRLPLEADASGLTPSGTVAVATVHDGFRYATHYHFEYVAQKSFEEHGWAEAQSTPEVEFGGVTGGYVGEDLPGLQAGGSYRYRLTATNTSSGDPVVHGGEQTLAVPAAVEAGAVACPNERFRTGPSVNLPDCRAYEQVTPHDKEGSIQPFRVNA